MKLMYIRMFHMKFMFMYTTYMYVSSICARNWFELMDFMFALLWKRKEFFVWPLIFFYVPKVGEIYMGVGCLLNSSEMLRIDIWIFDRWGYIIFFYIHCKNNYTHGMLICMEGVGSSVHPYPVVSLNISQLSWIQLSIKLTSLISLVFS